MAITQLGYHETLINNYINALNGAINATDTTLTVDSTTGLPTTGYFRLQVGNEIMLCEGAPTATTIKVTVRGHEGTTATSHNDNATVKAVLTATALQRFMLEHRGTGFTQTEPIRSMAINRILNDANNVIEVGDLIWINQGTATATDVEGGIVMTTPDEANYNIHSLVAYAPPPPWRMLIKLSMAVGMGTTDNSGTFAGITVRESSTGKMVTASARYGGRLAFWEWTNNTTFNAIIDTNQSCHEDALWLRVDDDGTNLAMRSSSTGIGFSRTADAAWWQTPRKNFLTGLGPNQIGIHINSGTNSGNNSTGPAVAHATFECIRVERL